MKQLARTLRRRTGVAMAEVDRLTGEVAGIARHSLWEVQVLVHDARRALACRPHDDGWAGCSVSSRRRSPPPGGCWPRPTSGWPATG
jgi:hypothetical protein